MFDSLRSRWITPRACTAAIAAAERRTTSTASRMPSGARRWRWPRSSPSSHSIAKKRRPSCHVPWPTYCTMFGCRRSARMAISRAKRARSCGDAVARSSLMAICCPVSRSTPRKMSPIPPLPTRASMTKRSVGWLNSGSTSVKRTRDPAVAEGGSPARGPAGLESRDAVFRSGSGPAQVTRSGPAVAEARCVEHRRLARGGDGRRRAPPPAGLTRGGGRAPRRRPSSRRR